MLVRTSAGGTRAVVTVVTALASCVLQPVALAGTPPVHNITQDTNYFTIQDAINAAVNGDVIRMDPGIYFESIDFLGKLIVVENPTNDFNDVTIGFPAVAGGAPIVSFVNGEDSSATLQFVTVAGGNTPGNGAGIRIDASSPSIIGCLLLGNSAGGQGGGIAVTNGGTPLIRDCGFLFNSTPAEGGALSVDGASGPEVTHCSFDGNSANGGGAISTGGIVTVTRCAFNGNAANFDGSAILGVGGNLSVVDCVFYDNHGDGSQGSAVSNIFGNVATVTNCTFASNVGNANGGFDSFASDATITNCIFWNNSPGEIVHHSSGTTTVSFSDVAGGWGGPGTNNIDANPLFVAGDGSDAHLTNGSPCVNFGDDNAPLLPSLDLDGLPRIQNCRTDMGAFESDYIGADCNANGAADECDIELDSFALDDGTMETVVTLGTPNHTFANSFDIGKGTVVGAIAVAFNESMSPGDPVTVYLWSDPNQDGLPDDAELLASAGGVIGASATNSPFDGQPEIFDVFPITPTAVSGTFFVGASTSTRGAPLSVDNSDVHGVSWASTDLGSINGAAQILSGILLVRVRSAADANANNIPDSCENPQDFGAPQEFEAFGEPGVSAVGDLDGNGTVDVLAVIPDESPLVNGAVQVLLNNGVSKLGKWQGLSAQTPITVGRAPSGAAVGLFNADAHLDLAITNAGDDNVTILLNNGDATFTFAGTVPSGGVGPSSVIAAQLNDHCDGFVDLAVTNEGSDNVNILYGNGAGGFAPTNPCLGQVVAPFAVSVHPVIMSAGDFDGNKCPDLSGAGNVTGIAGGQPGAVFVLLGNGVGGFTGPFIYPVGDNPLDITVGDLNFDGFPDIATANAGGTGTVTVLINDGTGHFTTSTLVSTGEGTRSVDSADLDGDTDDDLAVVAVDPEIGPAVIVFQNIADTPGEVAFAAPQALSVDADPNFVLAADMNGDPALDLVTVNSDSNPSGGSVTVLLNSTLVSACPWDMGGDGEVGILDFLNLLSLWDTNPGGPPDFDADGTVNARDFMLLLNAWGPCPS